MMEVPREVADLADYAIQAGYSNVGFCIDCTEEHSGVRPYAMDLVCNNCGHEAVYGARAIVFNKL